MPSRERVQELISYAEAGKVLEAIHEFYAEDATQQERGEAPRVGRAAHLEFEKGFLATVAEVHVNKAASFVVDGNQVAINWIFEYTNTKGLRNHIDEIAYQVWQGDKIQSERFYYDPSALQF